MVDGTTGVGGHLFEPENEKSSDQVGEGGAQRLLPRGRHTGAADEVEGGESGEAA